MVEAAVDATHRELPAKGEAAASPGPSTAAPTSLPQWRMRDIPTGDHTVDEDNTQLIQSTRAEADPVVTLQ